MLKKPNLSYILKLVEGDNYVCNQEICKCRQKAAPKLPKSIRSIKDPTKNNILISPTISNFIYQ